MGTQLMLAGLANGDCGEAWNLAHPERVLKIQRSYVEAGADCLITNTFGGSRLMLKRHGHVEDLRAINQAGARLAREAFGGREGFVLGDLGPLGAGVGGGSPVAVCADLEVSELEALGVHPTRRHGDDDG